MVGAVFRRRASRRVVALTSAELPTAPAPTVSPAPPGFSYSPGFFAPTLSCPELPTALLLPPGFGFPTMSVASPFFLAMLGAPLLTLHPRQLVGGSVSG